MASTSGSYYVTRTRLAEKEGVLTHVQHGPYSSVEKTGQLGPEEGTPQRLPPRQPGLAACPRPGMRLRKEGAPRRRRPPVVPQLSSTTTISNPSWFLERVG
jgi:hypothetical protein